MLLAPHVESVVFDNDLTLTAHHATRRTIDDNIPHHLISYFDTMIRRKVGQLRDDIIGLSDSIDNNTSILQDQMSKCTKML